MTEKFGITKKIVRRFETIVLYSASQSLPQFLALFTSWIVIKYHSANVWGNYVEISLIVQFLSVFSSFGHSEFLLKTFSQSPNQIDENWAKNFSGRSILLIPLVLAITFLNYSFSTKVIMAVWLIFLHISRSFPVLILFRRDFKFSVSIELITSSIILASPLMFRISFDLNFFLIVVSTTEGLKCLVYGFYYWRTVRNFRLKSDFSDIKKSLPYFLPFLMGTIRIKIDSYFGLVLFVPAVLAHYQIFVGMLELVQRGATFLVNPYLKNLYRLKSEYLNGILKKLFLSGLVLAIPLSLMIHYLIKYAYQFNQTTQLFWLGYLYMLPLFIHLIIVRVLFRYDQQTKVAKYVTATVLIQAITAYFVIREWGIEGALLVKLGGQWVLLLSFLRMRKRLESDLKYSQ